MGTRNAFYFALKMLSLCVFALGAVQAQGADYPERPIKVVVPWGAGGGSDQMARALTKAAESVSDANFVLQNMPGASGEAGLNYVMKQPADGYTIYQVVTDQLVEMAKGSIDYRLGKDIQPLVRAQAVLNFLFVNPDESPFSNFDEMIEYARAHEGKVKVGTTGINSFDSAMLNSIEDKYDIKFKIVPFNKPAKRYAALQGGFIDVLFEQPADVIQFIKNGTFKPILLYSDDHADGYPDVPTTADKGIDNATPYTRGFWVRSGTPKHVIEYLNKVFSKAVETEQWHKFNEPQVMLKDSFLDSEEFESDEESTYKLLKRKMN